MLAKIDTFTDEEFIKIVSSSTNMAEIARKLGYFPIVEIMEPE